MSLYATSGRRKRSAVFDLLSLDRLLTGPVIHMIYWGGLALILLFGFGAVGASAGLALRELSFEGLLVAIPALVAGLLIMAVLALLWRGACEFFVAVFSIAENLNIMRAQAEREGAQQTPPASGPMNLGD
ncbi:DUF4282 domain-containing protein [Caulobacter sp. S45]|uniref:DUF4282 domain-containing protein n=1 Tax=Caulobacter sp. S45 TaxID=1641861 RepID=UPI00131BC36A|nr:DUF4282 domain-containing protein [Caulobacter sp. S45]